MMRKLTRLEAAHQIRKNYLVSVIDGEQPFEVWLALVNKYSTKSLIALFYSCNKLSVYSVKITAKQALHFIKRHYPRKIL